MTRAEPHTITTRLVIAAVAALALVPSLAFSQTTTTTPPASTDKQSTELETIEVTGSRIKRTDYETASPIQVLSREDIEKTGKPNIGEVLRSISADNQGTIPTAFTNGFAAGSSAVSLRGLGVNSTLVLVNGRRMATYGLADDGSRSFVDLNSIPLEAVERIDVLKDGASALYGSDAVGGVVNIILRKNYEGASAGTAQGISQQWDGQMSRYFGTIGMGNLARDGYNGFVSIEAYSSHSIGNSDREGYLGTNDLRPWTGFDNRRMASPAGFAGDLGTANSPYGIVIHNGLFEEVTPCQERVVVSAPSSGAYPAGGLCVYDVIGFEQIQPEEDRLNAMGRLTTALGDSARMYAEASQFYTEIFARGTPGSWTFGGTYNALTRGIFATFRGRLAGDHPDNPTRAVVDGGDGTNQALQLRYLGADGGGRNELVKNTVNRYLVGIEGDIEAFNNAPLSYDIGAMFVKSKLDDTNYGFAHRTGVVKWINGIGGSNAAIGTTPYRVNNPAENLAYGRDIYNQMYNDIYHGDNRIATSDVTLLDGHVSMPLAELPGGPLSLALGGEWRKETSNSPSVPGTDNGEVAGLGYSSFSQDRKVYAAYFEVGAPVLPELELTGAARFDHYSDFGNSTTPKVGFKYKPIDEFALRGTYAQAFRAPGPAEFSAASASLGFTNIGVLSLGNPALEPETSDSYTLGFVAEPTDTTNLSVDYYLITREKEVIQADQAAILPGVPGCGAVASTVPGAQPGSFVVYGETAGLGGCGALAPVALVGGLYQNSSETETSGLDIDFRQKFQTDYGKVTAGVVWTHLISFERTINGTVYDYVGTHGPFVLSSAGGTPEDRAVISLNLDRGAWNTNLNVNWYGPMALIDHNGESLVSDGGGVYETTTAEGAYFVQPGQPVCGTYNADGTAFNNCQLSSWYSMDLVAKYAASQNWTMNFGINNLTDKVAPLDPYTYGGTNYHPANYQDGAVGRFFTVGLKYEWK